jgi:hypothetical protein
MVLMVISGKASRTSRHRSPVSAPSRCRAFSVSSTRCLISAAALRVKVMARMLRGGTRASTTSRT